MLSGRPGIKAIILYRAAVAPLWARQQPDTLRYLVVLGSR